MAALTFWGEEEARSLITPRVPPAFVLAMLLLLSTMPVFVGAVHGSIHVEAVPQPVMVPMNSTAGWVNGMFHITHTLGMFQWHVAYDPIDGTWVNLTRAPYHRSAAGSAAIGPVLYVAGGRIGLFDGDPACITTPVEACAIAEAYNASNRTWARLPDMPTPRRDPGVAALDGRIYVVGGVGASTASRAVEMYDPATRAWTTLPPLPFGRLDAHSLTALDGKLYLAGGLDENNAGSRTLLMFHPLLNVWAPLAELPVGSGHASAGTCGGKLLLFGGAEWDAQGNTSFAEVMRQYDPTFNQWSIVADYQGWVGTGYGGSLTAGDITMAVSRPHIGVNALRCPTGIGPWATMPDLRVESLAFSSPSPEHGDVVDLVATVRNRGAMAAGATNLSFARGSTQLGSVEIPALAAGEASTITGPSWTAIGGNATFTSVVDTRGAVDEWGEDNNVRSQVLSVRAPDLVVTGHALVPASAGPGDTARVAAVVRNIGDADAKSTSYTSFSLNGASLFPGTYAPMLAVGAQVNVLSREFTVPAGAFTIVSFADLLGDVVERIENNNGRTSVLEGARPDLRPIALVATMSDLRDDDTTAFVATVANEGGHGAAAFRVRFLLNGSTLSETEIAGVAAGSQVNVTSDATALAQGAHAIRVVVDDLGAVNESDETDNELEATVNVGPPRLPDLTITALLVEPEPPRPGQRVTTSAIVTNAGEAASGATLVRFTRDGLALGDAALPALAPGESATITAPQTWLAVPGTFTLRAVADPDATVAESNDANNTRERSVTVNAAP